MNAQLTDIIVGAASIIIGSILFLGITWPIGYFVAPWLEPDRKPTHGMRIAFGTLFLMVLALICLLCSLVGSIVLDIVKEIDFSAFQER